VVGRIVYLFQVQLDGLGKGRQGLVNRVTLAGHVNLQALRDVLVLFAVQRRSESTRRLWHAPRIAAR